MNSPIPYFGGKSRLAQAIIERIPTHKTYAEAFGGAAWVLFKKQPAIHEALNDLDRHLMNFYRILKAHPQALLDELSNFIPGREMFHALRQDIERPLLTDIQRAAIYYYIQRFAFSGRPKMPSFATAPNHRPHFSRASAEKVLPEVSRRLSSVTLENLPWERFLELYDSPQTFFFIDPPYWGHSEYRHNFKADDFAALAEALKSLKGKFLLTHSASPMINTKLHSIGIECQTPKFLKNRQSPIFQRLAGGGRPPPYQVAIKFKAI